MSKDHDERDNWSNSVKRFFSLIECGSHTALNSTAQAYHTMAELYAACVVSGAALSLAANAASESMNRMRVRHGCAMDIDCNGVSVRISSEFWKANRKNLLARSCQLDWSVKPQKSLGRPRGDR